MPNYSCNCCFFNTPLKSNYTNHLITYKHIRKSEESKKKEAEKVIEKKEKEDKEEKIPGSFICKNCNKSFNFKQSMYRHIKNSCKEKDLKELVTSLKNEMDNQAKEFNKKLDYLTMKMEKLVGEKS